MKSKLRIVGIVIAISLVILVLLPFFINVNAFRPRLESELTETLGRQVKVGNLGLSILSGSVSADDLSIADDPAFSQSPFVRAKSLKVGVEWMPLIMSRSLHVTSLTLDRPEISLLRTALGKWNFSSLGGKAEAKPSEPASAPANSATPDLSVSRLNVSNGRLVIGRVHSQQKPQVYDKVNIEVRDFSYVSQFPFTLTANLPGSGDLKLEGKAGPINSADTALTPFQAGIKVHELDLAASGFIEPASGIAGLADFDGTVTSDGRQARTTGTLKADKLKLNPKATTARRPVEVKYSLSHDLQKQSGTLSQGDISIGKAVARLTGNYRTQGDSTVLDMKLVGQSMPVDELQAMLPALGVTLPSGASLNGGTLSTSLDINGPLDRLASTGPIKLSNTKLAGFDLGSKMSAVASLTGGKTGPDTSIQNFSTHVYVAPNGIRTEQINLVIPALGEITGTGTISSSNALDFKMNAKFPGGSLVAGLTQLAGLKNASSGNIPFLIQGTTSDPRFLPDVKGLMGAKMKGLSGPGTPGQTAVEALTNLFGKKKQK
jgi:AsmA protein